MFKIFPEEDDDGHKVGHDPKEGHDGQEEALEDEVERVVVGVLFLLQVGAVVVVRREAAVVATAAVTQRGRVFHS